MTMKERFKTSGERPLVRIVVLALFVILFVLFGLGAAPFVRDLVSGLFISSTDDAYALLPRATLTARLKQAEEELLRVRYQSILYDVIVLENQRLREAARAVSLSSSITARVLARPPQTLYDSLLVNQGSEAGVVVDAIVTFEGVALGRVVSLGKESAVVELFSSPDSKTDVLVGEPVAVSVAHGLGGGSFELSVPQEVAVAVGDAVRLPASDPVVVGVVAEVSFEEKDATKTVRFASPVSFSELDFVQIFVAPAP